jgi:sulfopyruvate decarboxylase subunit alpha
MKEQAAIEIIEGLKKAEIDFIVLLPDREFALVQKMALQDKVFTSVPVSNEGVGVAIAGGAWLGGKKPALLIPTSGLLVAAWPLASLCMAFEIPLLILIPYRGDIGDPFWYMGVYKYTTESILNALQVPYVIINKVNEIGDAIRKAQLSSSTWLKPIAILFTGETIW